MKRDPRRAARKKFEAWFKQEFAGLADDGECTALFEFAWQVWQAATPKPAKRTEVIRCWAVTIPGWAPVFTMAKSSASARIKALYSLQDAGYSARYVEITARRSPDHDCLFEKHGAFSNLSGEWAAAMLARHNS